MLKFNQTGIDERTVLSVEGELVAESVKSFISKVHEVTAVTEPPLILDMFDVSFIDSSGIGSLIGTLDNFKRRGHMIQISRLNPLVKRALTSFLNTMYFEPGSQMCWENGSLSNSAGA